METRKTRCLALVGRLNRSREGSDEMRVEGGGGGGTRSSNAKMIEVIANASRALNQ